VYNQCCEELCEIAIICVHKEEEASAESTVSLDNFPSFVSVLCWRETPPWTSNIHIPSVGFWHVQSTKSMHQGTSIKLWYGHSCSLCQCARELHDAAATHPCPSVAARLLPTQTITRFVLHGETKRCSRPVTGKAKSGDLKESSIRKAPLT